MLWFVQVVIERGRVSEPPESLGSKGCVEAFVVRSTFCFRGLVCLWVDLCIGVKAETTPKKSLNLSMQSIFLGLMPSLENDQFLRIFQNSMGFGSISVEDTKGG